MTSFIWHSASRLVSTTRLSLFSLALASGVVFSQGAAWAADPSPAASGSNTHVTTAHHPVATHPNFKGTVTAVTATSLTVAKKKTNKSHTFQLSPETTVSMSQHVQGSLSDLAVGQHVQVQSSPDGSKALHVHVRKSSSENKSDKDCNCQTCPGEAKEHNQHHNSMPSPSASDKKEGHAPANN